MRCHLCVCSAVDGTVDNDMGTLRPSQAQSGPSSVNNKLQEFLSGRKGNKGIRAAALKPSKEQLAAQQRQQEQQRLLKRKMKRQFMSSKVRMAIIAMLEAGEHVR